MEIIHDTHIGYYKYMVLSHNTVLGQFIICSHAIIPYQGKLFYGVML